jgi:magnesium and cobalt transporter
VNDPLLWLAVVSAILSSFFSLNGYALRATGRHSIEQFLAARPRVLSALLDNQVELQLVCALLRTIANLTLLVGFLSLFHAGPEHPAWTLLAVAVTAAIVSVVGVAIPHAWANFAGAQILAKTAPLLLALRRLFWPVVAVMRAFEEPVRRLSGAPETYEQLQEGGDVEAIETAAKAELLHAASEAHAEGAVEADEMRMIRSIIEFGDQQAGEIMTPRTDIYALPVTASAKEVREQLTARPLSQNAREGVWGPHTRIPVYEGDIDNIVGILHVKDLLSVEDWSKLDLHRLMRKPFFVPETKPLDELLKEFKARKLHMAIVLDEYGGTAGLITLEDLVEEIVGEISDEHDLVTSALIKRVDKSVFEVDGRTYINDLNEVAGLHLSEEEGYDTVAGFVFSELGFVPPVGETLVAHGAKFTVLAADERRISRIRVEVLPKREET